MGIQRHKFAIPLIAFAEPNVRELGSSSPPLASYLVKSLGSSQVGESNRIHLHYSHALSSRVSFQSFLLLLPTLGPACTFSQIVGGMLSYYEAWFMENKKLPLRTGNYKLTLIQFCCPNALNWREP